MVCHACHTRTDIIQASYYGAYTKSFDKIDNLFEYFLKNISVEEIFATKK